MSANLSRTWSRGSASLYTAAWSAQGSDTWCTVSPVRQKPAPWTVWHRAIPHWAASLLRGRSWRQERAPACSCWVWRPPLRDALLLPDLVWRVSARRHPWGWAPLLPRPRIVESGQLVQACQLALLGLSGASNEPLPGGKRPNGAHCSHRVTEKLAAVPLSELVEPGRSAA